jgi:SNF2 family DNA or RNA helicase
MIYYSNGYDLEKRLQSEARIDRIGQDKPMTYIDLVAEDTIDIKIQKALRNKMNIANDVMGEELKEWVQNQPRSKTFSNSRSDTAPTVPNNTQ